MGFHHLVSIAFALVHITIAAVAPPNLVYPLQLQRPPVARVNETWSWTLYPGTFNSSSGSTISLSSQGLPSWATFDAATASFGGFPNVANVGSTFVTVQANASGIAEGASDGFELIVLDAPGPFVRLSIASQIPMASNLGGGGTVVTPDGALRVPPEWSFSLGFQQYTFQTPYFNKIYYTAYETGTLALPYWLKFDNNTVTFGGVAPDVIGEFSVTIFGSDVYGYGDVSQIIKLAVGYHSFELLAPLPALNTTRADTVSYAIPFTSLRLDNATITTSNVSSIAVDLSAFPYLSYSNTTRVISGTIPATAQPSTGSIPIVFTDVYNDTATSTIAVNIVSSLFMNTTLPSLQLVAGQPFVDNLSNYVSSTLSTYRATVPSSISSWFNVNSSALILSGTPPAGTAVNATVQISAFDPSNGVTSTASLAVRVALPVVSTTSSSSATLAAPTATGAVPASNTSSGGLSREGKLAIGIVFGILGAILFVVLIMAYCRRYVAEDGLGRRQRRDSSLLIFDQATIAAAQKRQNSTNNTASTKATLTGTPTEKDKTMGATELGFVRGVTPEEAEHAHPEASPLPPPVMMMSESSARPFDLLALLKKKPAKKEMPVISLPISQNSLQGLGIGQNHPAASPRQIAVVSSVVRGPMVSGSSGRLADAPESDLERSSSWESQGSSSWFYSEGSDSDGVRRHRKPPSAPRQRRDFLPLPLRRLSPSVSRSNSQPAVRLVPSASTPSASDSNSNSDFDSRLFPPPVSTVHPLASSHSLQDITSNDETTLDSITPEPRLIPFTQERRASQAELDVSKRYSSQTALRNRDSEMMDAEEADPHRLSALYVADAAPGSPVTAPIYFATPVPALDDQFLSPNASDHSPSARTSLDEGDEVRLIGSAHSSPYVGSATVSTTVNSSNRRSFAKGHRRTMTSSSYGSSRDDSPGEIALVAGQPFRFTPRLNPAPFASISTPARGGPPKAIYVAMLDRPDNVLLHRKPLPTWCRFNPDAIEVFGTPSTADVGFLHLQIVERKAASGSPQRRGSSEIIEEVVARYVLQVSPGDVAGVWEPITY